MDEILFYKIDVKNSVGNIQKMDTKLKVKSVRPFKSFNDLKWQILTHLSFRRWILQSDEGVCLSIAHTNSKAFIFPFMPNNSIYIGKCSTPKCYRRRGYYTTLLKWIISRSVEQKNIEFVFITVNKTNIPSIKGIEKAGFKLYGYGYRDNLKRYIINTKVD